MRILIIAYQFPPCGGGGVQRITKFVKYLSLLGHEVEVVTAGEKDYTYYDHSLIEDIPSNVKITRIQDDSFLSKLFREIRPLPNSNLSRFIVKILNRILRGLQRIFLFPDKERPWSLSVVRAWYSKAVYFNPDVVFSTSAPISSHLVSMELGMRLGLPVVADFRDPWTRNLNSRKKIMYKRWAKKLESKILEVSTKIVVVSEPMAIYFKRDYNLLGLTGKIFTIPNGYDEDDFKEYTPRKVDYFEILFAGSIYAPNSIDSLLAAVKEILLERPELTKTIRLSVVGTKDKRTESLLLDALKSGLIVNSENAVPHNEIIKRYETAALLAVLIPSQEGSEAIFTGKLFEYLRAKKRILLLASDGVAASLVKEKDGGSIADPCSVSSVREAIEFEYKKWLSCGNNSNEYVIDEYSRFNQTKMLEVVLSEAVNDYTFQMQEERETRH